MPLSLMVIGGRREIGGLNLECSCGKHTLSLPDVHGLLIQYTSHTHTHTHTHTAKDTQHTHTHTNTHTHKETHLLINGYAITPLQHPKQQDILGMAVEQ